MPEVERQDRLPELKRESVLAPEHLSRVADTTDDGLPVSACRRAVRLQDWPSAPSPPGLLAPAVTAGESPTAAIARIIRLSGGEPARELGAALGRARSGVPLVDALKAVADHTYWLRWPGSSTDS